MAMRFVKGRWLTWAERGDRGSVLRTDAQVLTVRHQCNGRCWPLRDAHGRSIISQRKMSTTLKAARCPPSAVYLPRDVARLARGEQHVDRRQFGGLPRPFYRYLLAKL